MNVIQNLVKKQSVVIAKRAEETLRNWGFEVVRTPEKKRFSSVGENAVIKDYLEKLNIRDGFCVDIGAADGISMSNTFPLFRDGWRGLAVECDGRRFSKLAYAYQNFQAMNLMRFKITPENVNSVLATFEVPQEFGFLSLDIDGYDFFVLEQLLLSYRPRLICVEVNEKIPPPIKFTVKFSPDYAWAWDHFYGQSISQLHLLCVKQGYALVAMYYNNAFLIPAEASPFTSLLPEVAYQIGYLGRPDRKERFPWNSNMEGLLSLPPEEGVKYIHQFYSKYTGKFICTI